VTAMRRPWTVAGRRPLALSIRLPQRMSLSEQGSDCLGLGPEGDSSLLAMSKR
jgi:hypothetical protein